MRIESVNMRQTILDEFELRVKEDNREQLQRIHRTHVSKMEQIFNEIFSKLFNGEEYIQRV
jgi:chromosome condensin MukBEF complex kleisin-like MukF subunit